MPDATSTVSDAALGHLVLRGPLGVNRAMHGLTRVGDPGAFAASRVKLFFAWRPRHAREARFRVDSWRAAH